MKRILAVMMAGLFFAGAIAPAITSASSWTLSQARMRKEAVKQQKAQEEFWKHFDEQMAKVQAGMHQQAKDAQQSK